jgi:hypothetical protein
MDYWLRKNWGHALAGAGLLGVLAGPLVPGALITVYGGVRLARLAIAAYRQRAVQWQLAAAELAEQQANNERAAREEEERQEREEELRIEQETNLAKEEEVKSREALEKGAIRSEIELYIIQNELELANHFPWAAFQNWVRLNLAEHRNAADQSTACEALITRLHPLIVQEKEKLKTEQKEREDRERQDRIRGGLAIKHLTDWYEAQKEIFVANIKDAEVLHDALIKLGTRYDTLFQNILDEMQP